MNIEGAGEIYLFDCNNGKSHKMCRIGVSVDQTIPTHYTIKYQIIPNTTQFKVSISQSIFEVVTRNFAW